MSLGINIKDLSDTMIKDTKDQKETHEKERPLANYLRLLIKQLSYQTKENHAEIESE